MLLKLAKAAAMALVEPEKRAFRTRSGQLGAVTRVLRTLEHDEVREFATQGVGGVASTRLCVLRMIATATFRLRHARMLSSCELATRPHGRSRRRHAPDYDGTASAQSVPSWGI